LAFLDLVFLPVDDVELVGFQVLTAVIIRSSVFWKPCLPPTFMLFFFFASVV
jgi:hypothetical protein